MVKSLNWKGRVINALSLYRTYYDQGIRVLAVIRNMEITDLGILMGVAKYLFGDTISTTTIVLLGVGYWVANALVNITVGRFYEKNNGWKIEAHVLGQRTVVSRTVLVNPDGVPYDAREAKDGHE